MWNRYTKQVSITYVTVFSPIIMSTTEAMLPKLELLVFCGYVTLWTSFWEQYQAVVHNSELPSITKFTYLLALLKGEAKACVQGLSLTASNYETACAILQKRFGRSERIIFSHIQELLKITVPRQPTIAVLWKMYYDLQAHMRSLEALNITGQQYGVVLTPLVLSRAFVVCGASRDTHSEIVGLCAICVKADIINYCVNMLAR